MSEESSDKSEELKESDYSSGSDPSQDPSHTQETKSNLSKGSDFAFKADTKVVKNEIAKECDEITAANEPAGCN